MHESFKILALYLGIWDCETDHPWRPLRLAPIFWPCLNLVRPYTVQLGRYSLYFFPHKPSSEMCSCRIPHCPRESRSGTGKRNVKDDTKSWVVFVIPINSFLPRLAAGEAGRLGQSDNRSALNVEDICSNYSWFRSFLLHLRRLGLNIDQLVNLLHVWKYISQLLKNDVSLPKGKAYGTYMLDLELILFGYISDSIWAFVIPEWFMVAFLLRMTKKLDPTTEFHLFILASSWFFISSKKVWFIAASCRGQ